MLKDYQIITLTQSISIVFSAKEIASHQLTVSNIQIIEFIL